MSIRRTVQLAAIVILMLGLPSAVMGQSRSGSLPPNPSRTTPMGPPTMPSSESNQMMLSGNIITDEGSPPSEPVAIERVCNGRVIREGLSDFKGSFTISIGPGAPRVGDSETTAETSTMGFGPRTKWSQSPQSSLMGCELRGSLAGFRSSKLRIPVENAGSEGAIVNVGTIVLERMEKTEGTTVSATSLNAPREARKAYDKGHRAVENNKVTEAQPELEKAVQLYPQYAVAWLDLGWVYLQQNRLDKARSSFTQAQAADSKFVPAYVGLSSVALRESKWEEAADSSARATQLDGVDFPAAFYYNALANFRLGKLELAEKSARQAETRGAQRSFPQVSLLLGAMLANRQEYAEAAEQLRSYLKAVPAAPNGAAVRQQLAELEKLAATPVKAEARPFAK